MISTTIIVTIRVTVCIMQLLMVVDVCWGPYRVDFEGVIGASVVDVMTQTCNERHKRLQVTEIHPHTL